VATAYAVNALGSGPIVNFASAEQKKKYLPRIATGELLCAFGLTEAQAGSDIANLQTTARKDNGDYVLNGVKQFISSGSLSDVYVVLASTDKTRGARGISAFIVEKDTPGFSFGKEEKKLGIRASTTTELVFEDCRIPKQQLMGKEGLGFIYTMRNFDRARPGVGAIALGIAQGAYEAALEFAHRHDLLKNQYVQRTIADMATEVEAARALIYAAARMIDAGAKNFTKEASFAKLYPSDVAVKVTHQAIEVLGPYGLLNEYRVEKMLRDAKITQIYEGTNQIQRAQIAIELTKEMGTKKRQEKA
jgi:butyryl-CoA dehydrogenase